MAIITVDTERFTVFEVQDLQQQKQKKEQKKKATGCRSSSSISSSRDLVLPVPIDVTALLRCGVARENSSAAKDDGSDSSSSSEEDVANLTSALIGSLEKHGYVILTHDKGSKSERIVRSHIASLQQTCFSPQAASNTSTKPGYLYRNEKGLPMYRLGYERCDDTREAFRVHGGCPDSQRWESSAGRAAFLTALSLCRSICDAALTLTMSGDNEGRTLKRSRGGLKWTTGDCGSDGSDGGNDDNSNSTSSLPEREGDYSVMYAMRYFTDEKSRQIIIDKGLYGSEDNAELSVKEHVDPSLFVLEPYLALMPGLQVYDTHLKAWITCDGPDSPILKATKEANAAAAAGGNGKEKEAMVLFVGRCFSEATGSKIPATLHRVLATELGTKERVCTIYEQKYAEYYPPPTHD
jgi:hypothetical protein